MPAKRKRKRKPTAAAALAAHRKKQRTFELNGVASNGRIPTQQLAFTAVSYPYFYALGRRDEQAKATVTRIRYRNEQAKATVSSAEKRWALILCLLSVVL